MAACDNGDAEPGELCFEIVPIQAPSGLARSARLANLDGDEWVDLVYIGVGTIQARRGLGDGTFEAPVAGPGVTASNFSLGLVNAGSDPDIFVPSSSSPGAALFYPGSADLTFGPLASTIGPGGAPSGLVALADLDDDGDDDAVVAGRSDQTGSLIYARAEAGGLVEIGEDPSTSPIWGLALGDVSGDENPDLIYTTGGATTSGLFLRLGDGSAGFEGGTEIPTDSFELRGVALGDLDDDGDSDIVYVSATNNILTAVLNDGEGSFTGGQVLNAGSAPHSVVLADVTNDGDLDAIVGDEFDALVRVFAGDGTGGFEAEESFELSNTGMYLSVGDVNGDDVPDVAVSGLNNPSLSLLVSNP